MIKLMCDKCGSNCDRVAFDIRVGVIHNPVPISYQDLGEPNITDDHTRYRFLLCQNCFQEMGFPNPYMVERGKPLVFRDGEQDWPGKEAE